jgi:methyl-accepting chemotaxis protein
MVGAGLALLAMEMTGRDDTALDLAAPGTIHLERVNGLVFAVVMESRGIYMSADWRTAEPFAKNLIRQLGELQDVARAWKADAIASQQSNIEELAERTDQFVRFRTELVRLGREESTAAARAFGDNVANRSVRTALNESLRAVAHAYRVRPSTRWNGADLCDRDQGRFALRDRKACSGRSGKPSGGACTWQSR